MELTYYVEKRRNIHSKNGYEYALNIVGHRTYTLIAFDENPSPIEIKNALGLMSWSVTIYRELLMGFFKFPNIELKEDKT